MRKRTQKKQKKTDVMDLFFLHNDFIRAIGPEDKLSLAFQILEYDLDTIINSESDTFIGDYIDGLKYATEQGAETWKDRGYTLDTYKGAKALYSRLKATYGKNSSEVFINGFRPSYAASR